MQHRKRNNQLPYNLPQLQNLIKRDPASYNHEFLQQLTHYQSMLDVFSLNPAEYNKGLDEIVMFLAQVSHCYPENLASYAGQIINLLESHNTILHSEMRMTFCRALILLRHKGLLKPTDLLSLFFNLLRCKDKNLRKFLQDHIITDVKNINSKHKDIKLNKILQNFMFTMLQDKNAKAAKMSLNIMIELYRKNIWNDAKTVNVISFGCLSKITKVMVAALKFFVIDSTPKVESDDENSSSSEDDIPNTREVIMANKVNKKTRKRGKTLKKVKKVVEKAKKKKKNYNGKFNAIHLIHDPQEFAEKLFNKLEGIENKGGGKVRTERFEVKLMIWDVISRLIGVHKLFVFNFYPLIQKRLQPHQQEATKFLQFVAQATHDLIPPDIMEPVLKALANNFVTEGNSSDVIAVGLNTIREMCQRAPLIMTEELLRDLVQYKKHRIRSVCMAAQSLIHVYRISMPSLLHRKDRGRPNEASVEVEARQYGEIDAKEFVPGAEVISQNDSCINNDNFDVNSSGEEDDPSSGIDNDYNELSNNQENHETFEADENFDPAKSSDNRIPEIVLSAKEAAAQRKDLATEVCLTKILTDEDFKKIEAAQLKKQITAAKRKKVPDNAESGELVNLSNIEDIYYKKKRHNKEERIKSILKGREGREKFGFKDGRLNPFSSRTNREREKKKNFMMIKHKMKAKVKRSFKDKQIALRNHLIKLSKTNMH